VLAYQTAAFISYNSTDMKAYSFNKKSLIHRVFADEHQGFLTWPKTTIPFLDKEKYTAHPRHQEIDEFIRKAESGDSVALEKLWQDDEILSMALKVSDAV